MTMSSALPSLRKCHPISGELLAEIPLTPLAALPELVARARAAQADWIALGARARGQALRRLGAVVAESAAALADLIAQETGKPRLEALLHEVLGVAQLAHYFGRRAARILRPRRLRASLLLHRRSVLHYVPRGVVAVISPWNFPLCLGMGDAIMALAAGNAVVLKPSEHTPLTGLQVPHLLAAAGIDPALVQVATGAGDLGAALLLSGVDMVHFTGSVATGRRIAATCGERLLPCVLELGGKDAALVLEDADLDYTARTLLWGAMANSGQACASVERVYAVGAIYAPLLARLTELLSSLRQGDERAGEVDIGPMITPGQRQTVQAQVAAAVAAGAVAHTAPGPAAAAPYCTPTLLTGVDDDLAICRDETFGPVLPIRQVADVEEGIRRVNASPYGLTAYLFTRNRARGRAIATRLEAGSVVINEVLVTHAAPETPWGGIKQSGLGVTHSDAGLRHLCLQRHLNYNWLPLVPMPWLFPYRQGLVAGALDVLRGGWGRDPWPRRVYLLARGILTGLRARR